MTTTTAQKIANQLIEARYDKAGDVTTITFQGYADAADDAARAYAHGCNATRRARLVPAMDGRRVTGWLVVVLGQVSETWIGRAVAL